MARRRFETGIVFGDTHIPLLDMPVFDMFIEAVEQIKPDFMIENGDGFDARAFVQASKAPKDQLAAQPDRELFIALHDRLNAAAKRKCQKIFLPGQHEWKMVLYVWDHPVLHGIPELEWQNFLMLDELGWDYRDFDDREFPWLDIGSLTITHGDIARKHSAYSAKQTLDDWNTSMIINHTHRLGAHWRTSRKGTQVVFENGCLCTGAAGRKYSRKPLNWQQGFSVVMVDHKTGWFRVDQIPIVQVPGMPKKRMLLHEGVFECKI